MYMHDNIKSRQGKVRK